MINNPASGFGLKSQYSIDYPSVWLDSGAGKGVSQSSEVPS